MHLTTVLCAQHIGRMINFHWWIQGLVKVTKTNAHQKLEEMNLTIHDSEEFLKKKLAPEDIVKVDIIETIPKVLPLDENHPDWKSLPLYVYRDENVLVEGIKQAKLLTNTVQVADHLPEKTSDAVNNMKITPEVDKLAKKAILLSNILDATQEKLPKRKDPERPAYNFRRDYGIPDVKRNELLHKNLVNICEMITNAKNRSVISNAAFSVPLEAFRKQIQLELQAELLINSSQPLTVSSHNCSDTTMPDIGPIDCTITLKPLHFYDIKDVHPLKVNSKWPHPHTAIVHYNKTLVKNLYEEEVLEHQIIGRSLMKAFCISAAEARNRFGRNVKHLPEPVSLQLVHSDGRLFHFCEFQLNTLDVETSDSVRNYFWNPPRIPLYEQCQYVDGRPVLDDYNPDVLKTLLAFYNRD